MKRIFILFGLSIMISVSLSAIPPFYSLGSNSGSIDEVSAQVKEKLESNGFDILGEYHPGNDKGLYVIVFSSKSLISSAVRVKDRRLLGAT